MLKKDSYIYQVHCEEKNGKFYPSSKRHYGGIGFCVCQVCILAATILSLILSGELSGTVASLLDFDLVTSASLLGLSSITRAFGGNKTSVGGKQEKDDENNDDVYNEEENYK